MTAGRSAGTEQGQGRECAICDDSGIYLGHRCSFCQPPWDPFPPVPPARHNHVRFSNDGGPWSPCPDDCPARDSGQPDVQSAARNLTSGPGMSSELDGGRQAAVEAVARVRALHVEGPYRDCRECSRAWPCPTVAALSQPGEPT